MSTSQERIEAAAANAPPSVARVGRWISVHPIQTLSHSAEGIAALTGTSVAAINRFARAAGFDGFAHLKSTLGKELQSAAAPVQKIQSARGRSVDTDMSAQIALTVSAKRQVEHAAGRLMKARQVWLLGLGASSYLVGYAGHILTPYLPQVWPVAGEGGTEESARRLTRCANGDVLLAMTLPRYSKDTVRLAQMARDRGAHVIGLTDALTSPLAEVAHSLLLTPSEHPLLSCSVVGAAMTIEALATAVMQLNPDAVTLAQDLSDMVLQHLSVPATSSPTHTKEKP